MAAITNKIQVDWPGRFCSYLLYSTIIGWLLLIGSYLPDGKSEIIKGLLTGLFVGVLFGSTLLSALSIIAAWRDRYWLNFGTGVLSVPLSIVCWLRLVQGG